MKDVHLLAMTLADADAAHEADVFALGDMSEDEIAYLGAVGDLEDPITDGVEGRCPT